MIAGTESAIRKIATPASSASTVTAAITAALEKILSPGRRRPPDADARIWPACVVVSVWASISSETEGGSRAVARDPPVRQSLLSTC